MTPKISVILPVIIKESWQKEMTDCCIKTMLCATTIPFELIIVETLTDYYKNGEGYKYLNFEERLGYNTEFNRGIDISTGDYIVHMGNDIFVRPGWLEAMLKCFEIPDCGASTLASSDLKHTPVNRIMEGLYFCIMMLKKEDFKFCDEEFSGVFGDTDLIMRLYESGKRMYRNWNVLIQHLGSQSGGGIENSNEREKIFNESKQKFLDKHCNSNLLIFRALSEGWIL